MSRLRALPPHRSRRRQNLWFERLMAIVVLLNLGLVVFDLTYVSLRNFWLLGNVKLLSLKIPLPLPPPLTQPLPQPIAWLCQPAAEQPEVATLITQCYDPLKGIQPNRETEAYLDALRNHQALVTQVGVANLDAPPVLDSLRRLGSASAEMISTNPFEAADKSGTLEKIKNLMRDRLKAQLLTLSEDDIKNRFQRRAVSRQLAIAPDSRSSRDKTSATQAFLVFWSPLHLNADNWQTEMAWFNRTIRPLIQTNYYRGISENGLPIHNFWAIDAPFVILFLAEYLARTFYLSRRYTGISWFGAMVWRWYDLPLIFPFGLLFSHWAWLRAVPAIVRLHQSQLVDLHQVRDQATQGFVSSIATEVTEVVVIQVIDQVQAAIQRGDLTQLLAQVTKSRIDINNVDEVAEIANLLLKLSVYEVFPKIQPDVEALLAHSLTNALNQAPAYQALKNLPGLENLSGQLNDRIAKEVIQVSYNTVTGAIEDVKGAELMKQLVQRLSIVLKTEVQQQQVLPELQRLLDDLLEELKLSYLHQTTEVNSAALMEETRQLKQMGRDQGSR